MTRDDSGRGDRNGQPGSDLQPVDVIKCRECGGLVRRVNQQHLRTERCVFTGDTGDGYDADGPREDKRRPDHPNTVPAYKEKYPDAPVMAPAELEHLSETNRDPEVDARRRELLRRRWRGERMTDIVESVAEKHGCSESRVWSDWNDRSDWIARVFGLDDAEAVVVESLAQKKEVRDRLLRLSRRAEDSEDLSEAIRALKAVDDNIDETIEHQQKLGKVKQATSKHEVEVKGGVSHEHSHEHRAGEGLDEDTLKALDALTGGGGDGGRDAEWVDAEYEEVDEE